MFEELEGRASADAVARDLVKHQSALLETWGLSGATLSGEVQGMGDRYLFYDPLVVVGCVLEVPAWPCSGVCANKLVLVAGAEEGG